MEIYANSLWCMWMTLLVFPISCVLSQPCGNTAVANPSLDSTLSTGGLQFAFNLYKSLASAENVFFSPYSVRLALAMTAVGARGTTLTQMNSALQLSASSNNTNQAFLDLISSFCSTAFYSLHTANRIYVDQTFSLLSTFIDALNQYYLAQAENVDFQTQSSAVTAEINKWVAQQTENTITQLLTPGSLDASTVMVIVNAIFFKGTWSVKFNSSLTADQAFVSSPDDSFEVPMMRVKTQFNYTLNRGLKCQMLQLNYTGNRLVMYVVLPQPNVDWKTVQNQLDAASFNSLRASLKPQTVDVSFPKFNLTFEADLRENLQGLGMKDVFDSGADLSGMSTAGKGLSVTSVVHQGFVAVDEEGTTAAAATAVVISKTLPPPPEVFLANRPFIFVIYDLIYDQMLFMGNFNNPPT